KTNEESFYTHPSYRLEKELLYWLTQLNEEKALFTMSEINQLERATLSNNPLRSLKNSIICSCTLFARAAIEAGVVPEISFNLSDVFIRKVEKAESFEMLHAIEVEMLKYFID